MRLITLALSALALAAQMLATQMLASGAAHAQEIPRTAEGRPDFHGYWLSGFLTQMQRPRGFTDLVVPPEQQADLIAKLLESFDEGEVYDPEFDSNTVPRALLEVNGEARSSWLVEPADGRLPLTALARAARDLDRPEFDNPENRPPPERCVDGLVNAPIAASFLMVPLQIVQTREAVVLAMEDMDPARIVSFADAPRSDRLRTRGGQSRGRWEGDTLVVETDRFALADPAGLTWSGGAYITADSKVIERFSLTSADVLHYAFTIEDPSLYTKPWRAEYVLKRIPRPVYEYACHEANHSIVGILTAARMGRQEEDPAQ